MRIAATTAPTSKRLFLLIGLGGGVVAGGGVDAGGVKSPATYADLAALIMS